MEVVNILTQLTRTAITSDNLSSSLRTLLQIWAEADSEFVESIRKELFSRSLAVENHTQTAQDLYSGQLAIAERMSDMEAGGRSIGQWLVAAVDRTNPHRPDATKSNETLARVRGVKEVAMENVVSAKNRIIQVEEFLKHGVAEDYPAFREARPLLIQYLLRCLVLQEAKVLQYQAEQNNREKLAKWFDDGTSG